MRKKQADPVRTNAVIYCRVSTEEQLSNLSMPTQEERSIAFCTRNGWQVIRVFRDEGKSAKTTQRDAFQAMLSFCKNPQNNIGFVVFHDLSRFSRSTRDLLVTRAELRASGVLLKSVLNSMDETPEGVFSTTIEGAANQLDNERKAQRTILGMKMAASLGRFPFKAPLGYLNLVGSRQGPNIVPDPKNSVYIKKAFELAASGIHSKSEILRIITGLGLLTARGRALSAQTFQKILTNPIYAGWVVIPSFEFEGRATFEALVRQEEFDRVQDVLAGKRLSLTGYQRNHPDFPLRVFVHCGKCGVPLTGSWSRGSKEKYAYYRCRKHGCGAVKIRQEALEKKFVELLEWLTPAATSIPDFKKTVQNVWKQRQGDANALRDMVKQKLSQATSRKNALVDLFLDKRVDRSIFDEQLPRLNAEINEIHGELRDAEFEYLDLDGVLKFAERIIRRPARLWLESSIDQRQRLQKTFFPSGITFDGKEFGTVLKPLFFHLLEGFSGLNDDLASHASVSWNTILQHLKTLDSLRQNFAVT